MKSPIKVRLSAVGFSPWIPIDYRQAPISVSLAGVLSSDASGITYSVQHTFDELGLASAGHPVSCSRSGTTLTVTDLGPYYSDAPDNPQFGGHGMVTGDNVLLGETGSLYMNSPIAPFGAGGDLGWQVTVTSPTQYTIAVTNAGPTADSGGAVALNLRVFNHDTFVNQTTRANSNYSYPVKAVRLAVTAYTAGSVQLIVNQGVR